MKPVCVAQFDERPRIAALPDGSLLGCYVRGDTRVQAVEARSSRNNGHTWGDPEVLVALPTEPGRWGGWEVLVDREGELHLFLMNDRGTRVFANPSDEGQVEHLGIQERRLDIWHCKTEHGRETWQAPKRIWKGYTGSINSVIQMREGRIVLPFARLTPRTWHDRGEGLDAFWFVGTSSSTAIYSDDGGDTWQYSPSELKVQTPSIGTYGAVEPVILQLLDGRVWMLIRTQVGRLYESFSEDGSLWSRPRPTPLISSDSPVGLVRLPDDRVVLMWNKCQRFPYAHGGRHVLHAAVSEDEGQTWIGQREVVRDPLRHEPPPPRGDHGTAYPYPTVMSDGKVIMTTGQGKGRIAIVVVDPDWLYETRQETDFHDGLEEWSIFGCKGVELQPHPDEPEAQVLSIARVEEEWPATAVWNFPAGARGQVRVDLCLQEGFGGAQVMLTDHFSVPFDPEDSFQALFIAEISAEGELPGCEPLDPGRWYRVELQWDCGARTCGVLVEGRKVADLPLLRETTGPCYLRLKADGASASRYPRSASATEEGEGGGFLVQRIEVDRLQRSQGLAPSS